MAKATEKQLEYAKHISDILGIDLPKTTDRFVIGAFIAKNKEKADMRQQENNQGIYERIKREIPIVDIAREMGYTLERRGHYYTLAEHDSVRINPETNLYIRNADPDNKGSVIDFVTNFGSMDKREAILHLSSRLGEDITPSFYVAKEKTTEKKAVEFSLPKSGTNMRNMYAYLTQSRYIEPEIVQYFVDRKMLYQDIRKNCVFVSYKGDIPVFASLKGTNTFSPYMGDVEGSDYSHCWYISNGADRLYVAEATIDLMSRMSMFHKCKIDLQSYDYLALAGAEKYEAAIEHVKEKKYKEIVVGLDNDGTGKKVFHILRKRLSEENLDVKIVPDFPKFTKDWNEELRYLFNKGYRYENYIEPSEKELHVLNEELRAIAEGNTTLFKELQTNMSIGNSEELKDYMFDYLEKNYDNAMEDFSNGGMRSIKEVLKNYNKQLPIKSPQKKPIVEKGIEV